MELRNLRYFLAVAREENMSRAAENLHVSQPTLSKALKSLEDELGKQLFRRHSFSIELTDEGVLLQKRTADLIDMADKIVSEFSALDDVTGGDIYLGLAESYQIKFIAEKIAELKKSYPDFHYHITSGDTEQVTEKLDKGLLDFAVIVEKPNENKYNFLKLPETDKWGVVMRSDCKLAQKTKIKVRDLEGLPLFVSQQSWEKDIPRWAGEKMDRLRLEGTYKLAYNAAIFAKEGLGYLLAFDKIVDTSAESGMVFRPLSPRLETPMFLIWKKQHTFSPIAKKFLESVM